MKTKKRTVLPIPAKLGLALLLVAAAVLTIAVIRTTVLAQGAESRDGMGDQAILAPLGTSFTYQGQLKLDGEPVDEICDFQFGLYDAASLGNQIGITQTKSLTVTEGFFTANLDFGAAFTGDARWLEVAVKCSGESAYTSLGRQELTAAPYALYALGAPWSGLSGIPLGFADGIDDTDDTVSWGEISAIVGDGGSQVAAGDHTHPGGDVTSAVPTATLALSAPWSGLTGVPTGFADDVDDDTTYTAGDGLEMAGTEMSVDFTAVAPLGHTHSFTSTDELKYFEEEALIPTNSAIDWESFTIGEDAYLAVANMQNDSTYNVNSKIYRWNGTVFTETQSIPTNGGRDWEFFTIGSDRYLAVANQRNDSTYNVNSKIYRWNGTVFTETQSISTSGATDWEFFTIGSDHYLAVANQYNDSTYNVNSKIYQWTGTSFVEFQSISTNGARDWKFFTIGSDHYLAVANVHNDSTHNIDSKIYRWNGASFVDFQSIPTIGAADWESFTIGEEAYLAVANQYNGSTNNLNSKIYRWNGASFAEFQSIATNGALGWEFFTVGKDHYLAVANHYNSSTHDLDSRVYRWHGTSFVEFQSIPTVGGADCEFLTIGRDHYLAVANQYDDSTYNVDSVIYKATLQAAGYIQLDTLAAAPPAADCDEVSERGRMKIDVVNDLLYICTDSGWVAK